jgi:hypothetical protein
MIDRETEQAVERWVKLGDEVAGQGEPESRGTCARCGSATRVLGDDAVAVCARCFLESGAATQT